MRRLIILYVCFGSFVSIFSQSWTKSFSNLTNKDLDNISNNKFTTRANVNYKDGLALLPNDSSFREEFLFEIENYNPELCVEMLYILDKPTVEVDNYLLYILNNFRAFSDLEGLEYFSSNRNKMYPLFKKSYFVNDKNKKINDPIEINLPTIQKLTFFQEDPNFGSNYFTLLTRSNSRSIWVQIENKHDLKVFGLFHAIDEGGQRMNFLIQQYENKLLIYAVAQIKEEPKVKKIFTFHVNVPGFIKNRMVNIIDWFNGRLSEGDLLVKNNSITNMN